uniref:Uncharacterized protein n=1 Tax=Oryza sativa subsp. japonica TaxID=39947 RepID=Q6K1N5_ORYSJ|nr:hypothetical protein [Oryza sativa Japonica Group]
MVLCIYGFPTKVAAIHVAWRQGQAAQPPLVGEGEHQVHCWLPATAGHVMAATPEEICCFYDVPDDMVVVQGLGSKRTTKGKLLLTMP